MNKKLLALGALSAGIIAEVAIHGYLDIMYKETIPQGLVKRIMNKSSESNMQEFHDFTAENCKWVEDMKPEVIDLVNDRGFVLKGYYLPAEVESNTFVLFAHGYRADHNGDPINFEKYYHERGCGFMSVDHTAAGDSQGDFVGFDYYESQDMLRWIDYLVERFGEDIKIILHGVSMGGATVCKMADSVPKQVKMIISDCAYTSALDQFGAVTKGVGISKPEGVLKILNGMNKMFAKFDLEDTNVRPSIASARVPMLFVHGGADDFVPTQMVYELYDLCPTDKDLLIVEGAGHAQSIMVGTEEYQARLDDFISKHLD